MGEPAKTLTDRDTRAIREVVGGMESMTHSSDQPHLQTECDSCTALNEALWAWLSAHRQQQ